MHTATRNALHWGHAHPVSGHVGELIAGANPEAVFDGIQEFLAWAKNTTAENPTIFHDRFGRSPLRTTLHAVTLAKLDVRYERVFEILWREIEGRLPRMLAVALDAFAPGEILTRIARVAPPDLAWKLANNPSLSPETVSELARHKDGSVRWHACTHPLLPSDVASEVSHDKSCRDALCQNPSTTSDLLDELSRSVDRSTNAFRNLVAHPKLARSTLDRIISEDATWRTALATRPDTTAIELRSLTATADANLRRAIAGNRHTPTDVLSEIALDKSGWRKLIREAIAVHPNCSDVLREELLRDRDDSVRRAAVFGVNVSRLKELAGSDDGAVRAGVCLHPEVTVEHITRILARADVATKRLIAQHTTFAAILDELGEDKDDHVRQQVARNMHTPSSRLEILVSDPNEETQAAAIQHASTPFSAIRRIWRKRDARLEKTITSGKGSPSALMADPTVSPAMLRLLANRGAEVQLELAESPVMLLEDLGTKHTSRGKAAPAKMPSKATPSKATSSNASTKTASNRPPKPQATKAHPPWKFRLFSPPKASKKGVPVLRVEAAAPSSDEPRNRIGGTPNLCADLEWPECKSCARPMSFSFQFVGKRGGGSVDLGPFWGIQAYFCDRGCDASVAFGANTVVCCTEPLTSQLLEPGNPKPKAAPERTIALVPGLDDARLLNPSWADMDEPAWSAAFDAAVFDKIGGVLALGNDPVTPTCPTCSTAMDYFACLYMAPNPVGGAVVIHLCKRWHCMSYQAVR